MWRLKIDQGVSRALFLTVLVVVVAKLSSIAFDTWMDDRQDEIVENQKALSGEIRRVSNEEGRARYETQRDETCRFLLENPPCLRPADFREAGHCLGKLARGHCDQLPDVQLCAAVEELELCGDVFEDQAANGCDRLRRMAMCAHKPAPDDRDGLWAIVFDDGLWHGGDD